MLGVGCDCAVWVSPNLLNPNPSPSPNTNTKPNPDQVPLDDLADLAADLAARDDDLARSRAELADPPDQAVDCLSGGGGGGAREGTREYPRAAGSPAGGPVAAALLAGVYPNARGEGIGRAHLFALRQLAGHGDGKVVTAKQPPPSEPKLC